MVPYLGAGSRRGDRLRAVVSGVVEPAARFVSVGPECLDGIDAVRPSCG